MGAFIKNVNISGYDPTVNYNKYDVVSGFTGIYPIYFVSISGDNTVSGQGNSGNLDTIGWASNAFWKRFDEPTWDFSDVWTPTYQTALNVDLNPKIAAFGDGYAQRSDVGLFFNKLGYELTFENINNVELRSIVSFLEYKGGVDPFTTDIPPFITGRKFVGKNWKHTYSADNINNLTVSFMEFMG